ncbi:Transcription-repair-coupling factor [Gracilariopsis chorda]|uniref:Transcription-repair-coupling factor n=1 Tax=Gracilariopsis chorda TaxID=448386 RepID=A0A2V3IS82_9FLOR|nr:Transcription-repair-coupling factor [Gracilariopsis chorda]|eukprot:PXF44972.1 Transcription-repair-coupling factor [Gracilariopsis chorda]
MSIQPHQRQQVAAQQVLSDLSDLHIPMDPILWGDVGFKKTEVAIRAAFRALRAGKQVVVLDPTTIMTYRHYETFKQRFLPFYTQ